MNRPSTPDAIRLVLAALRQNFHASGCGCDDCVTKRAAISAWNNRIPLADDENLFRYASCHGPEAVFRALDEKL